MTNTGQPAIIDHRLERVQRYVYAGPPEVDGATLQLRLIYRGALHAETSASSRAREKQAIREYLHPQIREFWTQAESIRGNIESTANHFQRCGYRFAPLVQKGDTDGCELDILFLRRDHPGNLVKSGGDIDNRMKVLFDGLKMPEDCNQLGGATPREGDDPFFCLLQDDSLITTVTITTDRLLTPIEQPERIHDVVLIIRASFIVPFTWGNI